MLLSKNLKSENGEYLACACGELYPSALPEKGFVSAVQEHLTDDGRVVISFFFHDKLNYMGADKVTIYKDSYEHESIYTSFENVE